MNYPEIVIYNYIELFNILNEISDDLNLKFVHYKKDQLEKKKGKNIFIISNQKIKNQNNYLLLSNFPYDIIKLLQLININLLRKNFDQKSKIKIGNYNLDVNSRKISNNKLEMKLTEKEIDIILFLNKYERSISIKEMQSNVWKYNLDLETHTVETHIHRLKKKFKNFFEDQLFIKSVNGGYKIN
tara:strand:- start:273 stop:827 length:555 start_codon:yes stop_codon:yes gene_type:complete